MGTEDAGQIPVIDLFAGPGGLNEGFSAVTRSGDRSPFFETKASFEMDAHACTTLRVRATFRRLRASDTLAPYYQFIRKQNLDEFTSDHRVRKHWAAAKKEVRQHELGENNRDESDAVIAKVIKKGSDWVLVGGPPCQAYSLAGRSRRANDDTWATDHKHVLYREYLHIIERFQPAVFVMENVKGMLSSQYDGGPIFTKIMSDLRSAGPGYVLRSFVTGTDEVSDVRDFLVRAENFGVPQTRHRVLLLGIRRDLSTLRHRPLTKQHQPTVRQMIGQLPHVRSRVTPFSTDSPERWAEVLIRAQKRAKAKSVTVPPIGRQLDPRRAPVGELADPKLRRWITDPGMPGLMDHVEKGHREDDLERYHYYATAAQDGTVLRLGDLPDALLPDHKNVRNATDGAYPFNDRFRVQRWDEPSGTIVSHISKDGHYFIHPDPDQMRSLTVREAARLQTFPDNYWFSGPPSKQYHQVGNAVPPWLAYQLGEIVRDLLIAKRETP